MSLAVGLDLSCLEARPETGVERYARRLVEHLPGVAPELEIIVFVRPGRPAPVVPPPARVMAVPSLLPRVGWRETAMPRAFKRLGLALLHAPVAAIPFRFSGKRVATIHDVPEFGRRSHEGLLSRHRLRLLHAVRVAERLIVPSVATREALVAIAPHARQRIVVIPHGVDPDFRPVGLDLHRERYGIPPGPYVLWVGTIRPRKDPMVLIEAFLRLVRSGISNLNLVMCGDPRFPEDQLRAPLREAGLERRLVLTGYVAREDMPDLYRESECVVVPSRLEGFGMTALEALACGKPLIVSEDAALVEVAGEACLTFKTGDPQDFARVLRHLLRDPHESTRLSKLAIERARGFSWEASAQAHADVYRSLLRREAAVSI